MDPLVDSSKSTVILLGSTQEVHFLVEYLTSKGLPATAEINQDVIKIASIIVVNSPSRFLPTFELGVGQKTSGADRLGEPKNQFSEL